MTLKSAAFGSATAVECPLFLWLEGGSLTLTLAAERSPLFMSGS
jgi:hypothetical protein